MTEQRIQNQARETAETLIEGHDFDGAIRWAVAAINAGDTRAFWLRVIDEIKLLEWMETQGVER